MEVARLKASIDRRRTASVVFTVVALNVRAGTLSGEIAFRISLFIGALVIAGAFTLMPGRIMHQVVFGP